jgi:hypothetical protein
VATAAGWTTIVAAALELVSREVLRRPALPAPVATWPHEALAAGAASAAAAVFLFATGRSRRLAGAPLLLAVLFCAGVAAQLQLGARLQSDGFYYFAYARSIAFDRDVDFANDYRLLGLGDKPHLFTPTPTGHAQSAWTIGPAILWAPFFAGGHLMAKELSATDANVSANGVSFPYRQAVCIAGLFYGLLGCWCMFRLTRRFAGTAVAAAATVITVAGSFMLWYLVKEPSMTHAPSMAIVAAFTWMWASTQGRRETRQWLVLGIAAGVMTLVRWQNAIFAVLPACDAAVALVDAWRSRDRRGAQAVVLNGAIFTAAATVAFLPQMVAWRAIYGSWFAISPIGPQIRLGDPHLADILWSARNGLFSTGPVLYVGAAGLLLFARVRPRTGIPAVLAFALMTWFNASIQDWWGSDGYGGRRFDGTLPLLCLGAAHAAQASVGLVQRFPALAVGAAGALLVLWNLTLMSAANRGAFRIGTTVSFGDTMAAQARAFHEWAGNPFTYPASLGFAIRNRVSPGRYDLLSGNRFLSDPRQPYGRIDIGSGDAELLGAGWHQTEREGAATYRWTTASAAFLVPLDRPTDLRVQVRLHAFSFPGAPEQALTLIVNGRSHGPLGVGAAWHVAELDVPDVSWRAGVNRAELRFAWAKTPAEAGLGNDARALAAAVDYIRIAVR